MLRCRGKRVNASFERNVFVCALVFCLVALILPPVTKALNHQFPPRDGDSEELGDCPWLARMLDKALASPEQLESEGLMYPCPNDQELLGKMKTSAETFQGLANEFKDQGDEEFVDKLEDDGILPDDGAGGGYEPHYIVDHQSRFKSMLRSRKVTRHHHHHYGLKIDKEDMTC